MKIALINASPKKAESASQTLLGDLKGVLSEKAEIKEFNFHSPTVTDEEIGRLLNCSAWVLAFPLYVDGLPSHLVSRLCQIEAADRGDRSIRIYAIANCGFYEGVQNRIALELVKNWCAKAGFTWGMGIGVGGGGAMNAMGNVPLGKGPKSSLGGAYRALSEAVWAQDSKENLYISVGLPKFLYKAAAEMGWKKLIKMNGGKTRDIKRKL